MYLILLFFKFLAIPPPRSKKNEFSGKNDLRLPLGFLKEYDELIYPSKQREGVMLNGKVALVTGSTSGIGLGIAQRLAREGCAVVLNGFGEPDEIAAIRGEIEATYGVKALYSNADMRKPEEIETMIEEAQRSLGSLDILVNNAGIQYTAPIEDFPTEKWDAILAINLSSAFHTIRSALKGMKKKGWGRIINIASAHGLVASEQKAAYVASKHGLLGLTKVVGLETATLDITCNAICPGWVLTPLVEKQIGDRAKVQGITIEEATKDLLSEKEPSLRFTKPEHIGDMVIFLCSEAGCNIKGAAFSLDGGWIAR